MHIEEAMAVKEALLSGHNDGIVQALTQQRDSALQALERLQGQLTSQEAEAARLHQDHEPGEEPAAASGNPQLQPQPPAGGVPGRTVGMVPTPLAAPPAASQAAPAASAGRNGPYSTLSLDVRGLQEVDSAVLGQATSPNSGFPETPATGASFWLGPSSQPHLRGSLTELQLRSSLSELQLVSHQQQQQDAMRHPLTAIRTSQEVARQMMHMAAALEEAHAQNHRLVATIGIMRQEIEAMQASSSANPSAARGQEDQASAPGTAPENAADPSPPTNVAVLQAELQASDHELQQVRDRASVHDMQKGC